MADLSAAQVRRLNSEDCLSYALNYRGRSCSSTFQMLRLSCATD